MRVVFIGGSVVFTRNLTRDILTFPELRTARSCSWTSTPTGFCLPKSREPHGRDGQGIDGSGRHDPSTPGPHRGRLRHCHDPGRGE